MKTLLTAKMNKQKKPLKQNLDKLNSHVGVCKIIFIINPQLEFKGFQKVWHYYTL